MTLRTHCFDRADAAILSVVLLAVMVNSVYGLTYTIQDLGVLDPSLEYPNRGSRATGINGSGAVVCGISTKGGPYGEVWEVPVVFAGGGVAELPSPRVEPGNPESPIDQITGVFYVRTDYDGTRFAGEVSTQLHWDITLFWDSSVAEPQVLTSQDPCYPGQLTSLAAEALLGPNVVGWGQAIVTCDPLERQDGGVLRTAETGFLNWLPMDWAEAVDLGGSIGGWLQQESGRVVACLKTPEALRIIGESSYGRTATDSWDSRATSLSPLTYQVCGHFHEPWAPYYLWTPFIYNDRDTVTIAGSAQPVGANDAGQVVLSNHNTNEQFSAIQLWMWREDKVINLYDPAVVPDLNDGWYLGNAVGIDAYGRIAARAGGRFGDNWETRAVLLVPDTYPTIDMPPVPMQITAWRSLRSHNGQELPIVLDPTRRGNGSSGPNVEDRVGGVQKIEIEFDRAVYLLTDQLELLPIITDTATGQPIEVASEKLSLNEVKTVLTIDLSSAPLQESCFRINLLGAVRSI